jgi:hypothetical protein
MKEVDKIRQFGWFFQEPRQGSSIIFALIGNFGLMNFTITPDHNGTLNR